jgi:DNA gyrase subunit B
MRTGFSQWLLVEIFRDGALFRQTYARGRPQTDLERIEPTGRRGTRLTFAPDPEIFADPEMSFDAVHRRMRELAMLNPKLRLELRDDRRRHRVYTEPKGLLAFVSGRADAFSCEGTCCGIRVAAAIRWGERWADLKSFANMESTWEHGTHVEGLLRGIADAVFPAIPNERRHTLQVRAALQEGLRAVVHVNVADAKFEGPTRGRLASPEAVEAVRSVVADQLARFLLEQPDLRASLAARLDRGV